MSDEQEPIVPAELPTAAIEPTVEPKEIPETILEPGEEAEAEPESGDGQDGGETEYVVLERNGKQYQIPKELEGEFLMQGDYTKKTQTVAERARELDARAAEIDQQAMATDEELDARATLKSVNAQLAEYAKLTPTDWQHHLQQDPMGVQQARLHLDQLKDQKVELEGKINEAQTKRTEKAKQDLANRVQETNSFAQKEIPGWKPELTDTLVKFALDNGVPEDALKANWSPIFYKLLHQAHIGSQAIAQQAAPRSPPKPPVTPLATVRAASNPTVSKPLSDIAKSDDMEAYAAARRAGKR